MIKILLVDDHDLVRTGVRRLLADAPGLEVIAEARTGEDGIRLAKELKPDVVLMDVKMPGIGGLEATRKLLRNDRDVKIIALTSCQEDPFPSRLLQAGAMGYLTKGASPAEMIQAIKLVFRGQRYLNPEVAQQLALKHVSPNQEDTPFECLSGREMQVLMMISRGQVVQDIAQKLCLSTKTVNSYRYRLFGKLHVNNDVELTHLAIRHGILDDGEC